MLEEVRRRQRLPGAVMLVLLGLWTGCLAALIFAAIRRPLWYDELFSYYIARLGTSFAVLKALLAGVDNGPPLDYWVRHVFMGVLGENPAAFRLPSVLALACTGACLWLFARRRMSDAAAATALLLPLATLAVRYATEGRAYALLLALASLSLLAWQRAVENPGSRGRLLLLWAALAAGPLCHYYGVLNYLPVAVGEVVRTLRCRRVSVPILVTLALSFSSLAILPLFARHAAEMKEHFWASEVSLGTLVEAYQHLLGKSLVPAVALCALAVLGMLMSSRSRSVNAGPGRSAGQTAAVVTLALTPVSVWVLAAAYTHAATDRYGIAAIAGVALLCGEGVQLLERAGRRFAWLATAAVLACGLVTVAAHVRSSAGQPLPKAAASFVAHAPSPIAVDSPQLFLKAFHYLPEAGKRKIIYLTNREASRRILGFDNDDIAIPKLGAIVPLETEPYSAFCARHGEFFVFAQQNRYWLLAQLAADGAVIDSIARFDGIEVFRIGLRSPETGIEQKSQKSVE